MDVQHGAGAQATLQEAGVERVQVARGEALQEHSADGRGKVNLNLRVMLGPRARPYLSSEAR